MAFRVETVHLSQVLGKKLICDIRVGDPASYQAKRLNEAASPKTVNLEIATVRAVLRKHRMWASKIIFLGRADSYPPTPHAP